MDDVGYAYSVFAVDLGKLKPARDKKLFAALREQYADDLARADEWFDDEIVKKGAPIRARALWELLHATPSQKAHGFQYGYALELLCRHFGERVDKISLTWFDDVLDPLLKKAKRPPSARLLGKGVRPMKVPAPRDFPEIGTVTPAGCVAGIAALAAVAPFVDRDDENVVMVVDEVRGWFERAKAKRRGLVWFVY